MQSRNEYWDIVLFVSESAISFVIILAARLFSLYYFGFRRNLDHLLAHCSSVPKFWTPRADQDRRTASQMFYAISSWASWFYSQNAKTNFRNQISAEEWHYSLPKKSGLSTANSSEILAPRRDICFQPLHQFLNLKTFQDERWFPRFDQITMSRIQVLFLSRSNESVIAFLECGIARSIHRPA